jgi:hypothetical protein
MPALVNLGDGEVLSALRSVLLYLLPSGVDVIRAYGNRVPEPVALDYCVLSPLRRERLSTNRDTDLDLRLLGGIAGDTLTVEFGAPLLANYLLFGLAVAPLTVITAVLETPGTYTVSPPQTVPPGSRIYAGRHTMLQPADCVYQCDVHGPNSSANAMIIQTTLRDERGCQLFTEVSGPLEIQPLYADDPRMVPFPNAEAQWEDRWVVDLHIQANVIVSLGQEFADEVIINLIPVDPFYAPHAAPIHQS